MGFDVCPITDEWELLLEALKPIRHFVLDVEVNVCSIGNAWNHFTRMKTELERLSTKTF